MYSCGPIRGMGPPPSHRLPSPLSMEIRYAYPLKLVVWISVFVSFSNIDTKWICRNSFSNIFPYPIPDPYSTIFDSIISAKKKQGTMNVLKSFLSITSDQLFNFIITNNALTPFNSISINNF
jgi:hypothetical protein